MEINCENIRSKSIDFVNDLSEGLRSVDFTPLAVIGLNSQSFNNIDLIDFPFINYTEDSIIYMIYLPDRKKLSLLLRDYNSYISNVDHNLKLSKNNTEQNPSLVLYVGSSTTDVKKRLKYHLGLLGSNVYSLHLAKWHNKLDYDLQISLFTVKSNGDKYKYMKRFLVEAIEQQMWDEFNPLFGKRSGL